MSREEIEKAIAAEIKPIANGKTEAAEFASYVMNKLCELGVIVYD